MTSRKKKIVGWVIILTLLLTLGFIIVAGSVYTSTSSSCTNCHEMNTRYVSWTRSTHARVECMDCHSGVGWKGYVAAKVGGARRMLVHVTGHIGNIVAHVEDEVCLKCHFFSKEPFYQYPAEAINDPLIMPSDLHRLHFKDPDSTCMTCHQGLVHGSLSGGIPIKKETCINCHQAKKIYTEIKWPRGS